MAESVEVLCVTMHQTDFSKYEEMNLSSDVVFANQADRTAFEQVTLHGHCAKMITTETRGVGRNRNLALLYAQGDILLFADDDVRYQDDYVENVQRVYARHPDADMIVFSIEYTKNGTVFPGKSNRDGRMGLMGSLKNGTCVFSVRRKSLEKANIWFSTLFGCGTEYAHGEDTLFLLAARRNMRVYGSSYSLGYCAKDASTCFWGYNDRYFYDQGVLYAAAFGRLAYPMALQFCIRKRGKYRDQMTLRAAVKQMRKGIVHYGCS